MIAGGPGADKQAVKVLVSIEEPANVDIFSGWSLREVELVFEETQALFLSFLQHLTPKILQQLLQGTRIDWLEKLIRYFELHRLFRVFELLMAAQYHRYGRAALFLEFPDEGQAVHAGHTYVC